MGAETERLVSIIIPVYQVKDTLRRCVLSCLNQQFMKEDRSTDGSWEICDELKDENEKEVITVINTKNVGVSHARNIGIERAVGRFITFVDSDDEVTEKFVENLMKYADEGTSLLDETKSYMATQKISGFQYIENSILNKNTHVWGKLFDRRTIVENHILFKENLTIGEDLIFMLEFALSQGKKRTIKCISDGDYIYKENETGAMRSSFKASYMDEITCWKMAEEKLLPFRGNLSRYAYVSVAVSQIMTALLVVGKVAVLDEEDRDKELTMVAISRARDQINHATRTQGAFAALPFGYKLKVMLFDLSPDLYLKMYYKHKRG